MTNKIFQDSEGTLALVREWARGRTQQLAGAFRPPPLFFLTSKQHITWTN